MKPLPRISVVIPSLNHARYLEDTLRSVLDQGYPNLELFAVDGGSTDGSVEVLRRYSNRLAGWVSERDEGQADAIAKGFRRCTGELLAYLNASDGYEPGAFRRVVESFARRRAALYYGDVAVVDEEGRLLDVERGDHLDLEAMVYENVFPFQPGTFWTREAYDRCGGIDPSFHFYMDLDLFVRLARVGALVHLPATLARLRLHTDAKTALGGRGWMRERERILAAYAGGTGIQARRIMSFLKRLGRFAAQRRWYEAGKMLRKARAGRRRAGPSRKGRGST